MADDFIEQRHELLQSIERDQDELRLAVHELASAARESLDLAERIRERPLTWALAALVLGLWLGGRSPATPRRQ